MHGFPFSLRNNSLWNIPQASIMWTYFLIWCMLYCECQRFKFCIPFCNWKKVWYKKTLKFSCRFLQWCWPDSITSMIHSHQKKKHVANKEKQRITFSQNFSWTCPHISIVCPYLIFLEQRYACSNLVYQNDAITSKIQS